jgi:L-malate glycosyltransferase
VTVRLLHVVTSAQRRGAEVFASDLIRALSGDGVDQRVALLRDGGAAVRYECPVTILKENGWEIPGLRANLGRVRSLRGLIETWKPDVVQAHGGEPFKHAILATRRKAPPVVYRRIGDVPRAIRRGPRRWAHARLMRSAARVVIVADAFRREMIDVFGVSPERLVSIPNGVDVERLRAGRSRAEVLEELGLGEGARIILSLGALSPEKDPLAHLAITRPVLESRPDAVHLIVGDGPLAGPVDEAIRRGGLNGRARRVGARDDVADLLGAADVLLVASRMEGLPGVIIEAGMVGLPVAAYRVAGVPEVVRDGTTGLLASPADHRALTGCVMRMLDREGERRDMGRRARELYRSRFDIGGIAGRYRQLYAELVG